MTESTPSPGALVFLAALAALAAATLASASPTRAAGDDTKECSDIADVTSLSEYWTEDRIGSTTGTEQSEPAPEDEGSGATVAATPTQADVDEHPYDKAGKLVYTKPDGTRWHCSAQFVGSGSIIMTAAHCVRNKDDGRWNSNFLFLRARTPNGQAQRVEAFGPATYRGFWDGNLIRWDYAFLRTRQASPVGHMPLRLTIPDTSFEAIGYPGAHSNGNRMMKVTGTKGQVRNGTVQMLGNNMRSGNSGGMWHSGEAIGLNSSHLSSRNEWGPYFDGAVQDLWTYASNGCR